MSADRLISLLTELTLIAIAGVTVAQAIRRPRRGAIDIAVLFSAMALLIVSGWLADPLGFGDAQAYETGVVVLLVSLPFLLLRVVNDFMEIPHRAQVLAAAAFAFLAVSLIVEHNPVPSWLVVAVAAYFVVLGVYTTRAFIIGARSSRGVSSRRLAAAAWGSALLGLIIVVAAAGALFPSIDDALVTALSSAFAAAIAVSWFVAFSPPRVLRQVWQQPELRNILARVAVLPRLPNTQLIVDELQHGAAAATGAQGAAIALYDPERNTLRYAVGERAGEIPAEAGIAGRCFVSQEPVFSEDAPRDDPEYAERYRSFGASAILAAPITAGTQRLGVLTVYSPRPPIFADDDLQLVQLLADQAAVILESRALIDATTKMQAREQATALRDEFLTAAAHDLRTPLTALITRAQLIRRRASRQPDRPIDPGEIEMIESDLLRLNDLINELLDTARAEHGQLVGNRERVDLAALAHGARSRLRARDHRLTIDAPEPLIASVDATRVAQLIDNLVENAMKYSPPGSEVRVAVRADDGNAVISVSDSGVGIPRSDLPHVFERFHRARNVDPSHASGLGLGLYICRGIAQEHGGRIEVDSVVGAGTTFTVYLPLGGAPPHEDAPTGAVPVRSEPA